MNPGMRSGFPGFLQSRLDSFVHPERSTLIILYYQGHRSLDKSGHLVLSKYSLWGLVSLFADLLLLRQ
jgi:hypothetical protein